MAGIASFRWNGRLEVRRRRSHRLNRMFFVLGGDFYRAGKSSLSGCCLLRCEFLIKGDYPGRIYYAYHGCITFRLLFRTDRFIFRSRTVDTYLWKQLIPSGTGYLARVGLYEYEYQSLSRRLTFLSRRSIASLAILFPVLH